jgi:hypothetical protein
MTALMAVKETNILWVTFQSSDESVKRALTDLFFRNSRICWRYDFSLGAFVCNNGAVSLEVCEVTAADDRARIGHGSCESVRAFDGRTPDVYTEGTLSILIPSSFGPPGRIVGDLAVDEAISNSPAVRFLTKWFQIGRRRLQSLGNQAPQRSVSILVPVRLQNKASHVPSFKKACLVNRSCQQKAWSSIAVEKRKKQNYIVQDPLWLVNGRIQSQGRLGIALPLNHSAPKTGIHLRITT